MRTPVLLPRPDDTADCSPTDVVLLSDAGRLTEKRSAILSGWGTTPGVCGSSGISRLPTLLRCSRWRCCCLCCCCCRRFSEAEAAPVFSCTAVERIVLDQRLIVTPARGVAPFHPSSETVVNGATQTVSFTHDLVGAYGLPYAMRTIVEGRDATGAYSVGIRVATHSFT